MRALLLLTLSTIALLGGESVAYAQVSPGPLSQPHSDIEGLGACATCHEIGEGATQDRCLACHKALANRIAAGRGYHSAVLDSDGDCTTCHMEHAGRDFELIEWPQGRMELFPHGATGFPLSGAHVRLDCRRCHRSELIADEAVRSEKAAAGALEKTFLGLNPRCASCHADPHRGEVGEDCATCHDDKAFKPAALFDHARAAFPLRGGHAGVPCAKCHARPEPPPDAAGAELLRFRGVPHTACTACHLDPHAGTLAGDAVRACTVCHTERAWREASFGVEDHARTRFALEGAHARSACASCHGERFARPIRGAVCASCHEDVAHRGSLGTDCGRCHGEHEWRQVRYANSEHAPERFPLAGRHAVTRCGSCHLDLQKGGAIVARQDEQSPVPQRAEPRTAPQRPPQAIVPTVSHTRASTPPRECARCHEDRHGARLGDACAACHSTEGWKRGPRFTTQDHTQTRYPLEGQHSRVACDKCHGASAAGEGLARVEPLPYAKCMDCHRDAHRGELSGRPHGGACETCHAVDDFVPAFFTREAHARAAFPLQGAHALVACERCHRSGDGRLTLKPRFGTCEDCHRDPHRKQFASQGKTCAVCHTTADWKARGLDHQRTRFPLRGAHRTAPCARCHVVTDARTSRERVLYRPLDTACQACHRDPHLGQFIAGDRPRECAACHDETRFRPATRFDHASMTRFALDGRHQHAACGACHDVIALAPGIKTVRYRGTPSVCRSCHTDKHSRARWREDSQPTDETNR